MAKNGFTLGHAVASLQKRSVSNRIVRFFPGSDMRCAHSGLREVALTHHVDPYKLNIEFVKKDKSVALNLIKIQENAKKILRQRKL